ncbi:MAG: SIR2 family protein [Victivallaceae bacterium]|nr:SIR2 family protein [Victivallaceae bacterium]
MDILQLNIQDDFNNIVNICSNLIQKNRLVLCLGAGFSLGCKTNHGVVPGTEELRSKLLDIFRQNVNLNERDLSAISKSTFSEFTDILWEYYSDKNKYTELSKSIDNYFEVNFVNVEKFPNKKKELLKCYWNIILSLNYDDAIERNVITKSSVILPYEDQNHSYLDSQTCIYKLHGDAQKFLNTGNIKYCILSKTQYINMLMDYSNKDMLLMMKTCFLSKSILFIGCSLNEEFDLIYCANAGLQQKSQLIDTLEQVNICLYYNESTIEGEPLTIIDKKRFQKHGITHLVIVNDLNDLDHLYSELANRNVKNNSVNIEKIDFFVNFNFVVSENNPTCIRNYEMLFNGGAIFADLANRNIVLPSFFIRRTVANNIIESINSSKYSIYFICGSFFSGKTFCLLDITRYFSGRKIYFFPSSSHIDHNILLKLRKSKNIICVFDSNSVSQEEIRKLCYSSYSDIAEFKKNNVVFVFAISKSDSYFFKNNRLRNNEMQPNEFYHIYELKNHFDKDETINFNTLVGQLSLISYSPSQQIFDYLARVEKSLPTKIRKDIKFPLLDINNENGSYLKAMIMIATEDSIDAERAIYFNIDESLTKISYTTPIGIGNAQGNVIERDYFTPQFDNDSGFLFVVNSKYWLLKCLQEFSNEESNYELIAQTYYDIIMDFKNFANKHEYIFHQKAKEYYFFDKIQSIFVNKYHGGSIALLYCIYNKIFPILCDSYQFLHQKAKFHLRYSRFLRKKERKKKTQIVWNVLIQVF